MKKRKTIKVKVPKRVAGMKIPKTIRKGPVIDFLNSSGGQVLIAEALLLVAGAYAARQVDPTSAEGEFIDDQMTKVKGTALSGKAAAKRAARTASAATERLSQAFGEGLRAFRDALNAPLPTHEPLDEQTGEQPEAEAATRSDAIEATEVEPQKKKEISALPSFGGDNHGVALNIRGEAEVRHAQRRGSVRKAIRKRLAASVRSWALDRARRRFEREWQDYQQPPELRLGPFFRRIPAASRQPQVFRSFIQVNFYPRPRG